MDSFFNVSSNYTSKNILQIDQAPSYFLSNAQEMICWNFTSSLVLVFVIFLVLILFKKLRKTCRSTEIVPMTANLSKKIIVKSRVIQTVINFCKKSTTFAFILITLIQSNSVFICFYAGLQLRSFFNFSFYDKANQVLAVVFLFVTLMVTLALFFLFWAFKTKRTKQFT